MRATCFAERSARAPTGAHRRGSRAQRGPYNRKVTVPVEKGAELELRIDSLAYGGNGVARLNGFVVFVRRGLPGDTVRARVTAVKRSHAEALALDVLEPGPARVVAPCPHAGTCGGCRFQDLAYDAQIAAKQSQVGEALARIGGIPEPPVGPIVPAVEQFHYRNKLEYSFTETRAGAALGFHRAGRWDEVVEIERCLLTTELGNAIRDSVRDWARSEGLPAYSQETGQGFLRHLVVREGRNTGDALAVLVTAPGELRGVESLVGGLTSFPQVRGIHHAVNDRPAEVTNLPTAVLWGEEWIEEELLGLRFHVRPNAFLQTNTAMCERLYELVAEAAGLTGEETVYDLYCGIGAIALVLARHALTVWGVEVSEESVACAIESAERNRVGNVAFFAGDVGSAVSELPSRAGPPDVVVVDPPRAGLSGKALRRIAALGSPRLVYVSCNPTTLAGNARELLREHGYRLELARPLDMFPHTPHVETVAVFTRSVA